MGYQIVNYSHNPQFQDIYGPFSSLPSTKARSMKSLDFGYVSVRDSMEASRAHSGCLAAESLSVIERDHMEGKNYIYIRLVEMGAVYVRVGSSALCIGPKPLNGSLSF